MLPSAVGKRILFDKRVFPLAGTHPPLHNRSVRTRVERAWSCKRRTRDGRCTAWCSGASPYHLFGTRGQPRHDPERSRIESRAIVCLFVRLACPVSASDVAIRSWILKACRVVLMVVVCSLDVSPIVNWGSRNDSRARQVHAHHYTCS